MDVEEKKQNRIKNCNMNCDVCKSSYIAFGEMSIIKHNNSTKHKKNLQTTKIDKTIKHKLNLNYYQSKN